MARTAFKLVAACASPSGDATTRSSILTPSAASAGVHIKATSVATTGLVLPGIALLPILRMTHRAEALAGRRCRSRHRIQRASHDTDRWLGSAQPVAFRKPGRIIVGKPSLAGLILPDQRLQRQVAPDRLNRLYQRAFALGIAEDQNPGRPHQPPNRALPCGLTPTGNNGDALVLPLGL